MIWHRQRVATISDVSGTYTAAARFPNEASAKLSVQRLKTHVPMYIAPSVLSKWRSDVEAVGEAMATSWQNKGERKEGMPPYIRGAICKESERAGHM